MDRTNAQQTVDRQRSYFLAGATRDLSSRRQALERLRTAITENEALIIDAVRADMRRAALETFVFEVGMIVGDVDFVLSNLQSWMAPRPVPSSPEQPWAWGSLHPEPYGVVLIQSAWNCPIMQLFAPLVGALAAGNTALLRPASTSPRCARAAAAITERAFSPELVACLVGPPAITTETIDAPVDYVFFTGSPNVGRTILALAAKHLTPVTLELGGKCSAIVDRSADLELAARRVAWGRLCNAGQICLSVDHVYVHREVMGRFVSALVAEIEAMVGTGAAGAEDLGGIIDVDDFERVRSYLKSGTILYGGGTEPSSRYVQPTILTDVSGDDPIMREEIFGPVLPVLPFEDLDAWIVQQQRKPKPRGLYVFARDHAVVRKIIRGTSAGGVCVNDTMVHSASPFLPFGGVGNGGRGGYHGQHSFDTFTHYKPVVDGTELAMEWRYMPYAGKLEALKAL